MGLEMDSIHAPTVNGASTSSTANGGSEKSLLDLINDRDKLESELKALGEVLVSHKVDMDTPLLTRDGFPRNDIDVPQIRTTRARIIWLRNDYKALMSKIEAGLHAHHALQNSASGTTATASTTSTSANSGSAPDQAHAFAPSTLEPPFARCNSVVSGSPAETAGLQAGDEVRRFGSANWTNHERLAQVAQVVQRSENMEILVKVKRKPDDGGPAIELDLRLVPKRNWGGRGMLGCHLVPV